MTIEQRLTRDVATDRFGRSERPARTPGLDPHAIRIAAYLPVIVHPDPAVARQLISGDAASYARFSVMAGTVSGPASGRAGDVLRGIHAVYDLREHYTAGSAASRVIDDEVTDAFAIAGPASYCVDRLGELAEEGICKVFVLRGGRGIDPELHRKAEPAFVEHVLPEMATTPPLGPDGTLADTGRTFVPRTDKGGDTGYAG